MKTDEKLSEECAVFGVSLTVPEVPSPFCTTCFSGGNADGTCEAMKKGVFEREA